MRNVKPVKIAGHDFYELEDGKLGWPKQVYMPAISGGAGNEEEETGVDDDSRPITLGDLKELLGPLVDTIERQDAMLQQQGKSFDELVEALESAASAEEEEDEEQEEEVDDVRSSSRSGNSSNDEVALLTRELKKMQMAQENLIKQLGERDEQAEEEREKRLAAERDNILADALREAGVMQDAIEAGVKLFRDNIAYDDDTGQFYFMEDDTNIKLPVDEGVADNIPDYLKEAPTRQGGSGGRGSQASTLLETTRKNVAGLKDKAQKSGQDADIAAYHAAKKQLLALEAPAENKKVGRKEAVAAEAEE